MKLAILATAMTVMLATAAAWAQFGRGYNASLSARIARADSFDGRFHYCRGQYRMNPAGDGGSWLTDYPLADIDLSIRLSELTRMRVGFDGSGQPQHLIVPLTGAELFKCPMIMMQEVGRLFFNDEDAAQLRKYLLKGGFLWVDDFWGSYAWNTWATQITKVFPPSEYPIVDLPAQHPVFHTMFDLKGVPQIPRRHIGTWRRQRSGARPRHLRSRRTSHGVDDAQHRRERFVGARG
jgi:Domain of unknown function (DUF4159)